MKQLTKERVPELTAYLRMYVEECIYLYIDLQVCGVDNPEVMFWFDENEKGINTVVMKYYDSFQIFSAYEDWNARETRQLLDQYEVTTVCGKRSMIERLEQDCRESYDSAYGMIVNEKSYREFSSFDQVETADEKDAPEIAALMCRDEEFGMNYDTETLSRQLAQRIRDKAGISFIIRKDGNIAAHAAVFAQYGDIAVESGLIVNPDYKDTFYGMVIHEYIKKYLILSGKQVFGFRIADYMVRYAKASREDICGYYGKLTKKRVREL